MYDRKLDLRNNTDVFKTVQKFPSNFHKIPSNSLILAKLNWVLIEDQ